jgi:hypothetical protein
MDAVNKSIDAQALLDDSKLDFPDVFFECAQLLFSVVSIESDISGQGDRYSQFLPVIFDVLLAGGTQRVHNVRRDVEL